MTVTELAIVLLLGTTCGHIHTTEATTHAVYGKWDELNHRLEQSCVESKLREPWVQKIMEIRS